MSYVVTAEQSKLGFQAISPTEVTVPRLAVSSTGHEKRGKSHWAFTAPGRIGLVSTDTGSLEVARKFAHKGKKFLYLPVASPEDLRQKGDKKQYDKEWDLVVSGFNNIIHDAGCRTIVADTLTEMWALCRLAAFGDLAIKVRQDERFRQWDIVNREFRSVLKAVYARPNLNAIFIHKYKKEYKQNSKGDSDWTGRYESSRMGDVPFLVDLNVENYMSSEAATKGLQITFGVRVLAELSSRFEPFSLIGTELEGEECTFGHLGMLAFPETSPDYWGLEL